MRQLLLELPAQDVTLDNFVAGRNAELLHTLRGMLADGPRERFVYLWGEPGSGRTHLLKAFAAAAGQRGLAATYVAAEGSLPDLSGCAVAAVDDVDRLDGEGQIALFNLYNRLREEGGMLLTSGPRAPAQLALRPDVETRLGWGLVFQVHGLSDAEKAEALQSHATLRGFALSPEVTGYLLRHWRRDLPSLMAALDALDRYSLETKRPVTVPLLRELLQAER